MHEQSEPEEALAAAIIHRAVSDVEYGKGERKRQAIKDIADGGLEYWVEVLSAHWDVYDSLQEKLGRLIGMPRSA